MFSDSSRVKEILRSRANRLASFWFSSQESRCIRDPSLVGKKALVVDAEDMFTGMLAHQLSAIGLSVTVCSYKSSNIFNKKPDLYIMGPGPGDPCSLTDTRILKMGSIMSVLLEEKLPFFAVCLSHQLLSSRIGLKLVRRSVPNQGVQREVELFGDREMVGFYNTFMARCDSEKSTELMRVNSIETCFDHDSGEVFALRGPSFASLQFHPESIFTKNGLDIIANCVKRIVYEASSCLVEP